MPKKKTAVVALPMQVDASGILETKLTRSEAIEIMLEEAKEQTDKRIRQIDQQLYDLRKVRADQAAELAKLLTEHADMSKNYHNVSVRVNFDLPATKWPKWLKEQLEKTRVLEEEASLLRQTKYALEEKGKAKLAIMKQVLESTVEGKKFLEDISKMAIALNGRMFEAAKAPPPPPVLEATTSVTVKTTVKEV